MCTLFVEMPKHPLNDPGPLIRVPSVPKFPEASESVSQVYFWMNVIGSCVVLAVSMPANDSNTGQ